MPKPIVPEVPAQPLYWSCTACTTWNEGGEACSVCQTERPGLPRREAANGRGRGRGAGPRRSSRLMQDPMGGGVGGGIGGFFGRFAMGFEEEEDDEEVPLNAAMYNGVTYDRPFNPEAEEPHPHESELWIVEFLLALFSGDDKMPVLFPHDPIAKDATVARLVGCAKFGKKSATWKELVRPDNLIQPPYLSPSWKTQA